MGNTVGGKYFNMCTFCFLSDFFYYYSFLHAVRETFILIIVLQYSLIVVAVILHLIKPAD